ncbi:uncharacterized protein LOC127802622 [Diospyros lotus]|uniref:uncharacterized protein LOC127802622 n=1 Tax=Diospyros lotus TaxID=55363 RepID=UPI00225AA8F2|nr:uncharacterized protein LOC127802622 [Diospyros lotus]
MRLKRGNKVDFVSKKEVPVGRRHAEIISGNGHNFHLKLDYPGPSNDLVDKVSRKSIRPSPPPVEGMGNWVTGDIVEVFYSFSWKTATVLKVLERGHYLVMPLGASEEFCVSKSQVRVRQSCQGNKWVVINKVLQQGSGRFKDVKSSRPSTLKIKLQTGDDSFANQENAGLQEHHMASSRTQKRAYPCRTSLLDAYTGNAQKKRAIEKNAVRQRFFPDLSPKKVDAVAYPRENLGETYMHSSCNNRSNGYYEMEREKLNGLDGCSLARSSEPNDSDSDACSVGSCSITSEGPKMFPSHFVGGPYQETGTPCSDAESFYGSGNQESYLFPQEEEITASIVHRLELCAYRRTLEALHASGPLSWEQEAMLTNLRIMLHISNDEHLKELRNLISARTS